jgi:MFS family permease
MSIRTQKRILLVTIPLVVIFPSICAVSALWTHTISSFEVVAISIAAVGASLLVIGVFVLMYLGERGEPAAQPDHWEQELRKVFFILILLVSGLLFLSLLIAILLAENTWRGNAEEITAVATVDVLILIGLLVITELFVMVNMLRKHKDTASARND